MINVAQRNSTARVGAPLINKNEAEDRLELVSALVDILSASDLLVGAELMMYQKALAEQKRLQNLIENFQ